MNRQEYYMNLPKDLSGSISKNRFRLELLWGISKIIDAHKEDDDYTVIFDFKCDIELHRQDEMCFYQIKTKASSNFTDNSLCIKKKNEQNSILGKLYALYSPGQAIKLAIVCNRQLKINKKYIDFPNVCFGELDKDTVENIKNKLKDELKLDTVDLENVFYIFDNMDFLNPEDAIRGKLIKAFVDIKGEEPQNPNALYRLVSDTVKEKASYEFDSNTYEEVVKTKGITRNEFDKMLNAHKKESKTGIVETQEYIKKLPLSKQRKYNTALGNLIEMPRSESLQMLKLQIYKYIEEHEDDFIDEECYLDKISMIFDDDFNLEFTKEMKMVQYLIIYYIYASGGEL
ncbi:MAG: DUF4297 domain-containing protein [Beduini sp.]